MTKLSIHDWLGFFKSRKLILTVTAFAAIGMVMTFTTKGAINILSIEPETSLQSGNMVVINDGAASDGKAILFQQVVSSNTDPKYKLGVFLGSGNNGVSGAADYETWLGREIEHTLDFLGRQPNNSSTPWQSIDNPAWWCNQWANTKYRPVFSVAILPNNNLTLASGASGNYNSHWQNFGRVMVNRGCDDAVLRLGWEFNGKFYPWAAGGNEAQFAAYWRQIVNTLRNVPGQSFRFDWTPLAGNTQADVEAAYPGDNYVDIIGLDAYDTSNLGTNAPASQRWLDTRDRQYGLTWHRNFAIARGKPVGFGEWGLTVRPKDNLGGGDNPYYIEKMYEWFSNLPQSGGGSLEYALYFEVDASDADHRLMTSQFPNSSARFLNLFGGP